MVEWINPLNVPPQRRRQTFAVWMFVMLIPIMISCHVMGFLLLIFPLTGIPMFFYYIWFLFIDKSHETGNRKPWARDLSFYSHFRDFFPISLVKTTELDPDRKYVFGYHPHGIISMGALCSFGTNATGFHEKFPGLDMHLLTLDMNFKTPFLREWWLSHGICSASKRSCNTILQRGSGSSIMLVVGGAAEALDAHPGNYELLLKRSGFVRVAIANQADLVPVLGFGEVDIFDAVDNPKGSLLRTVQDKFQKVLGFSIPLWSGRGIFNYSFGFIPHRRAITTVVGAPIKCPKFTGKEKDLYKGDGKKMVERYHAKYVQELKKLWNEHRKNYIKEDRKVLFKVNA